MQHLDDDSIFVRERLIKEARENIYDSKTIEQDFFRCMCLCHDVTRVRDRDGKAFLTGPSQDELCLLDMAESSQVGYFIDRDSSRFHIEINGVKETYKNIKFYDFDSSRKMMSRVVQNERTGIVYVMAKGADSAIVQRVQPRNFEETIGQ